MPGRDYTKAYARFEQSLGDTNYPTFPPSATPNYPISLPASTRSRSFAERLRIPDSSKSSKPQSPRVETHLLPPTPPPGSEPPDPSFGLANRLNTPELTPDTRHGTPFTNLEAPTPNSTPPSPIAPSSIKQPRGLSYDSSRAESFQTAQEDSSPRSDIDSPIDLPLQGARNIDDSADSRMEVYALGLRSFDRVTEVAHRRLLQTMDLKRPSKEDLDTLGSVRSSKDSGSMRKRRKVDKVPKELTFLEDPGGLSLKSPTNQESPSSWLDGSSSGESSPVTTKETELNTGEDERLMTPESKILPSSSDGSPMVEASIVDSPPRHHHPLRHVSKNAELRRSPPEGKRAQTLGNVAGSRFSWSSHSVEAPETHEAQSAAIEPKAEELKQPDNAGDSSPPSRTRSLLSPRVHSSVRSKWRRSAPGLSARDAPGGLARNTMEVVPEDKPLPESPQPAAAFDTGEGAVASPRRGSEHSMAPSERSPNRLGVDRHMDRMSSRNTFARSSPVSDASDALVRDATAVNIYPHNNDSVLVVEHPGSSSNTSKDAEGVLSRINSQDVEDSQPELLTPVKAGRRNSRNVSSPLTNPRRPPEPPAVSVIPPAPAKHHDAEDASPVSPDFKGSFATRQSSLSRRAKRYSDSLTGSLSRFAGGNRSKRSSVVVSTQPVSPDSDSRADILGESLHPTWRPRGFLHDIEPNTPARSMTYPARIHHKPSVEDFAAAENAAPSSIATNATKGDRRLSLRRLLSTKQDRAVSNHESQYSGPLSEKAGATQRLGSQRRGFASSFRQRLQERNMRREEQRHQERQEKLRHSIGTRFYVEHGAS